MSYETVNGLFTGIADAIRSVDGTVDPIAHQDIPTKIGGIPAAVTAAFTADATATESDILLGETAYAGGVKLTGTCDFNANVTNGVKITQFDENMDPLKAEVIGNAVWPSMFNSTGSWISNYSWDELLEVSAPDVVTIHSNGFYSLSKITTISAPICTTLASSAVYGNSALTELTLPELTTTGTYNVYSNTGLLSLSLPKCVSVIGIRPLGNNTALTSCQLGSIGYSVTTIVSTAFYNMTQLGLTITVYVTPGAQPLANSPWGATNATIVYRSAVDGSVL